MAAMPQIVLLAGVLLLLYGLAVLAGGRVAASRPIRSHSRAYGAATGALGGVLVLVGIGLLVGG